MPAVYAFAEDACGITSLQHWCADVSCYPQMSQGVSPEARAVLLVSRASGRMPLRMWGPSGSRPIAPLPRYVKGTLRMFRPPLRVVAFLVGLLTLLGGLGTATAQEATPPAGTADPATFRALAAGLIEVLEPSTANVVLGRITLQPGATIPFDATDPSALLVYMASGELTLRVEAAITVARAAGGGTPTP